MYIEDRSQRGTRIRAVRLGIGVLAATAALTAVPSMASAAPSPCTYDPGSKRITVTNTQGTKPLKMIREGTFISTVDPVTGIAFPCARDSLTFASVFNTDDILIKGTSAAEKYVLDFSAGRFAPGANKDFDGTSEIEVFIDSDPLDRLEIIGPDAPMLAQIGTIPLLGQQNIRLKSGFGIGTGFGLDLNPDINVLGGLDKLTMQGGIHEDHFTGLGGPSGQIGPVRLSALAPSSVPLELRGGGNDDELIGGKAIRDILKGEAGEDTLRATDGTAPDFIDGGADFDFAQVEPLDAVSNVEQVVKVSVGKLRLTPSASTVKSGGTAQLKLRWTHPKAWKALRSVELRLLDGDKPVGRVAMRPATGRVAADGDVALAGGRARIGHRGKTVTADLPLRIAEGLAGKGLRLDVHATDRAGREQVVNAAGMLTVAP